MNISSSNQILWTPFYYIF